MPDNIQNPSKNYRDEFVNGKMNALTVFSRGYQMKIAIDALLFLVFKTGRICDRPDAC
jgi:hypothetical protein